MPEVKEPEWTADNQNRKQGDTTFKICGWCKHVGCGSCRYGCHMDGYCELVEDSDDIEHGQTTWDRKCIVVNMGRDDIEAEIGHKKYEIENTLSCLKELKKEIITLKGLKKKAKYVPPQPDNRDADYFNEGDKVWVFDKDANGGKGIWESAIVVPGYRSHDGCVSFIIDGKPGKAPGCGMSVPCILSDKEFKFFQNNPVIFKEWLVRADRDYNGEKLPMGKYFNALAMTHKGKK